ncbi:DUF4878 domain-containing protein [Gilliamella apis]|uniref:DUF4878 domain-containing protein n=1 Tax=Gilliamella apis TaxID=1970738 RepID=UPI00242B3359|nr:DUF4878 domain-containing protein [Gilliamella apis]
MKLLVKFLSVFLLALVVTACSSDDNTPEVAAEKFIKDSYSGNVDGILDALYIPDELKTNGVDIKVLMKSKMKVAIDQAIATAKQNGGFDRVELSSPEYNNDKTQATIKTIIIFKDGTENNSALSLIKVDGKWLINIK